MVMALTAIKVLISASTTNNMAANLATERSRVMVMMKDTDVTGVLELQMSTWRRKAMAARKATATRLDMVPVTTMVQRRATVMTRAMDKTPSMVSALARMSTANTAATADTVATAATINPTALTLATARSRAMEVTGTTAVWINMLVKSPTVTRRLMATKRSTASPPSMVLTTNINSMMPMVQSRVMELIKAMDIALNT